MAKLRYYKREEYVRPGEMRYLALKAGQKYSRGRKLSEMQLVAGDPDCGLPG